MKGKWIGFATVVCVSLFSGASAEDVNFPDANLEAAVRDALGIPAPTPITDTDMAGLVSLSAVARDIANIQGLEYGINLTRLNLYNNQISDISPVAGLTNLTYLELPYNDIIDISGVAGLTSLGSLDLRDNQISDISPAAGLTNLSYLDLRENQISDISPVAGLTTNLTELYLDSNQISNISAVAGLANLAELRLRENQISDISPVAGLTNLPDLRLGQNQISDISAVAGLTNLTWLELDHNQISDISALAGLTNLTGVRLGSNQISDISAVAGLTNLVGLGLYDNQISDISAVASLTNLTWLQLENNQIEIMDLSGADLSSLYWFSIGYRSVGANPLTIVLLVDAAFSRTGFDALMRGDWQDHYLTLGIAELPGVLILDMSGVDFAPISDLSRMYYDDGMDDLERLLLAGATNLDGAHVVSVTGELNSLRWLDVRGLWDSFDVAEQGSLNAWDAVPGNTLITAEPAAADANYDGCVDGLDYIVWSSNYKTGTTWWWQGDFNGDGYVDGLDYIAWSNNYKVGCPGQIPEPASALVLALGLFFFRKRSSA